MDDSIVIATLNARLSRSINEAIELEVRLTEALNRIQELENRIKQLESSEG